jgi:DNA-binding Lrp family transcriptional regulator
MLSVDPSLLDREEQLVFYYNHEWTRDDALKALQAPDVFWVAWKFDGGLTVQAWPKDPAEAIQNLTLALGAKPRRQSISTRTSHRPLSLIDWQIVEALIDDPTMPLKTLIRKTGLSPKTARKHLESLIREQKLFISPRMGALTDSGEIVYTIAVFGKVSVGELRKLLGDAFLINQTQTPPSRYLLCRSNDLADVTAKTELLNKLQGVEHATVTLNREFLVSNDFMHKLVREKIKQLESS